MEFSSSIEWNQQGRSSNQVGLLVRESSVYTGLDGLFDFECILCELDNHSESFLNAPDVGACPQSSSGVKFTLVMGYEYGNRKLFSHKPRPSEISHLELKVAMGNRSTAETQQRIQRCSVRFQKTVNTLLKLINPLNLT